MDNPNSCTSAVYIFLGSKGIGTELRKRVFFFGFRSRVASSSGSMHHVVAMVVVGPHHGIVVVAVVCHVYHHHVHFAHFYISDDIHRTYLERSIFCDYSLPSVEVLYTVYAADS